MKTENQKNVLAEKHSIRVVSATNYEIEVNDAGDIIAFDITDIELPFKLERAKKMASDAQKWLKGQQILISKKKDMTKKGDLMTVNKRQTLETFRECIKRLSETTDEIAGTGARQKTFGDKNYLEMFNDFIEQMEPHFDKMQLQGVDVRKRIEEKYGDAAEDEI